MVSAPRSARIAAQAKINLVLRVGPRRDDGFHDILTLFQLVDLADDVIVRLGGAGRTLHVAGPRLPDAGLGPTEKNLAWRAAIAYCDRARWSAGFSIELTKNIPTGGGLGGGSSDAGAVLRGLDALNERPLGPSVLAELAATLGSDVPFFVSGSATAIGAGRGDQVAGIDPLPKRDVLLAVPPFGVATADAYRWLDEARASRPKPTASQLASVSAGIHDSIDWPYLTRASFNDFEPVVELKQPALADLRAMFADSGAVVTRLSGSGSTVFGIYDALPSMPASVPRGTTVIRTRTSDRVVPVEARE